MTDRYSKTFPFNNNDEEYKDVFSKRVFNSRAIQQFPLTSLKYPSPSDISSYDYVYHIWSSGDRLYKLADQYYNDPKAWWVIAWFNKKPTEHHFGIGDTVSIPFPLSDVLDSIGVF